MNLKKILKEIYPIDEYKELKKSNPVGFYITILIPLLLLFTFIYLYFFPFGYSKTYVLGDEELKNGGKGALSFSKVEEKNMGLVALTFDPKIGVRNPYVDVSVEGEDSYVLPIKEDILDVWDFSTESFKKEILYGESDTLESNELGEYTYGYVDNYDVRDEDMLSVYVKYMPSMEDQNSGFVAPLDYQLLFKYGNMRLVHNAYSLALSVDEVYDGELYTYITYWGFDLNFYDKEHEVVAVYQKSVGEKNGYIDLVVDGYRAQRQVVVSPYNLFYDYDDLKKYEEEIESEVLNDLNQSIISLGQEIYRVDMEKGLPRDVRKSVDLKVYYEELYKSVLPEKHIGDMYIPLSVYYDKNFYNYFNGYVYELRVGYVYPFEKLKSITVLYPSTPLTVYVAGEDIENILVNIYREGIWKKLGGL
jgi:hypothetical protein